MGLELWDGSGTVALGVGTDAPLSSESEVLPLPLGDSLLLVRALRFRRIFVILFKLGMGTDTPLPSESKVLPFPLGDGLLLARALYLRRIFVILYKPIGAGWPPGFGCSLIWSGGLSFSDLLPSNLVSSLFDPLPPPLL